MSLTLYIVRHAKAEDRAPFLTDHARKLTPDGTIAAARMGRYLRDRSARPDRIISSTAARAQSTADVIAEQLGYDPAQIERNDDLYEGGPKAYMAAIQTLPDDVRTVMLVGHNPDVSYFAEFLTHQNTGSMSKGAAIAITFEKQRWTEVSGRTGQVAFQIAPKQLSSEP